MKHGGCALFIVMQFFYEAPYRHGGETDKKQAFNPSLPSYEYVPDGEPHVFEDRLYVFGSHDRFNGKEFCMNDYVGWSCPVDDFAAGGTRA